MTATALLACALYLMLASAATPTPSLVVLPSGDPQCVYHDCSTKTTLALGAAGWQAAAPMLHKRLKPAVVVTSDGRTFVFGGNNNSLYDMQGVTSTEVHSPTKCAWTNGPAMPAFPASRQNMAGATITNRCAEMVLLCGGQGYLFYALPWIVTTPSIETAADCAVLNTTSLQWTDVAPMQTARHSHAAVTFRGLAVMLGGFTDVTYTTADGETYTVEEATASVEMYVAAADMWVSLPPMLTARANFAAVVIGNRIYVAGGDEHCIARRAGNRTARNVLCGITTVEVFENGAWHALPHPSDYNFGGPMQGVVWEGRFTVFQWPVGASAYGAGGVWAFVPANAITRTAAHWITPAVPLPPNTYAGQVVVVAPGFVNCTAAGRALHLNSSADLPATGSAPSPVASPGTQGSNAAGLWAGVGTAVGVCVVAAVCAVAWVVMRRRR